MKEWFKHPENKFLTGIVALILFVLAAHVYSYYSFMGRCQKQYSEVDCEYRWAIMNNSNTP